MIFVRFGILKPFKQVHFDKEKVSSPPLSKGFFAFPHGYVDEFLLMNIHPSHTTQKTEWVKVNGQKVAARFNNIEGCFYDKDKLAVECNEILRKQKIPLKNVRLLPLTPGDEEGPLFIARFKKANYFEYQGEVWHHLHIVNNKIRPNDIIQRFNEEWILTSTKDYERCLNQICAKIIFDDAVRGELKSMKFDYDLFEVFIEKI